MTDGGPGAAIPGREGSASLETVAREWTRIGVTGFGGPPAHIALLRKLVVDREGWMDHHAFEDANAACSLLPGPSSTQLAIFCAYRVAGWPGAIVGGLGFVVPAVVMILALSLVFLSGSPPDWIRGAGAGAGAAVAAVAVRAGGDLLRPSHERARREGGALARWAAYGLAGGLAAATIGPWLVLVLVGCGLLELAIRHVRGGGGSALSAVPLVAPKAALAGTFAPAARLRDTALAAGLPLAALTSTGTVGDLVWTALKVGALSFGGGFVIVPLMQGDAVHAYHWMSNAEFLNAVALGQVTPGPVVATVAAVGYGAYGIAGGLLAALVAFLPSFSFILLGGGRFERLRANRLARAFLAGAGPAAIGAILGSAVPLAGALSEAWQFVVLGLAAIALLLARRGVVSVLLAAGAIGATVALTGAPLP
ncbi:MAG TPA: chromate efflux transporter [Solirubrobacterales bacterium]|nr:chromate efflux transporter [Solirubrobacterales bacterium]